MNKFIPLIALVILSLNAHAATIPEAPSIDARSYVLLDYASGQVLAGRDEDMRVEPASITKVMTIYIAFDELKKSRIHLDDQVLISEKAWRQGIDSSESRMFLEVGKRAKLEDLLRGVIIQSGNDASVALAEHIAGSEQVFAGLMNQYAQRLGMKNSHFADASGMPDPNHYTSAHDLAILARALIHDFPDQYKIFSEREFVYNGIKQGNRNILLGMDPGADGVKTGHTRAAGYCLLSSIQRDGRRLIAAVMGTNSIKYRAQASLELLNYGFRFFDTVQMFGPAQPASTMRVWKGTEQELPVGVAQPIVLALPRGAREQLQVSSQITGKAVAPIQAGQPLGMVTVSLEGKVIRSEPLVALKAIPEGSLWQQVTDSVRMLVQ